MRDLLPATSQMPAAEFKGYPGCPPGSAPEPPRMKAIKKNQPTSGADLAKASVGQPSMRLEIIDPRTMEEIHVAAPPGVPMAPAPVAAEEPPAAPEPAAEVCHRDVACGRGLRGRTSRYVPWSYLPTPRMRRTESQFSAAPPSRRYAPAAVGMHANGGQLQHQQATFSDGVYWAAAGHPRGCPCQCRRRASHRPGQSPGALQGAGGGAHRQAQQQLGIPPPKKTIPRPQITAGLWGLPSLSAN